MRYLRQAILAFLKAEEGPTAVEYAVMLAMIILACLAAVMMLGTTTNQTFNSPKVESVLSPVLGGGGS